MTLTALTPRITALCLVPPAITATTLDPCNLSTVTSCNVSLQSPVPDEHLMTAETVVSEWVSVASVDDGAPR